MASEIEIQPTADRLEMVIRATLGSTVNAYVLGDIISLVRKGIAAERESCARLCSDPATAAAIRQRGKQ